MGDVNFNIANLVTEKLGKINKDYTLLNPPIGKGSSLLTPSFNNLAIQGAFGEVRKAIHKKTGLMRAVKIINKTSKEEQEKLVNEVNVLKELVFITFLISFNSFPINFTLICY